jgi:hypothetical protein
MMRHSGFAVVHVDAAEQSQTARASLQVNSSPHSHPTSPTAQAATSTAHVGPLKRASHTHVPAQHLPFGSEQPPAQTLRPAHTPAALQRSSAVHGWPSSQSTPSPSGVLVQVFVAKLHTATVQRGARAAQSASRSQRHVKVPRHSP